MKPLIPPNFVNVSSDPTYDDDLSDALFRTYVRIRGLAWQFKYQETPPLTIEELAEICHHKVRAMWGHLSKLRKRKLITWHSVGNGRLVFNLQPAQGSPRLLQNFAVAHDDGVIVVESTLDQQQPSSPSLLQNFAVESVQNFAVAHDDGVIVVENSSDQQQPSPPLLQNFAVDARASPILDALVQYGVDAGVRQARDVAELEHVSPDFVHTWGQHLEGRPGVRNLPGLLLYKLRSTSQPPRTDERRGGYRPKPDAASHDGADVVVSTDLLRYAGFSLHDARALAAGIDRPDPVGYVGAMVSYAYEHLEEPLGFLRRRLEQEWELPEGVESNERVRAFVERRIEALEEFPGPLDSISAWCVSARE